MRYNRDWLRYLTCRFRAGTGDELLTFNLRNGQSMVMRADVRFTLNEIYLDRVYDIPGHDLTHCRTVLDVGANMGVFALYVAARAPEATIYCLEPASANFGVLKRNLRQNGIRAKAYRLALSPEPGKTRLLLAGTAAEYALGGSGDDSEIVECVDLEHLFALTGVETFDLVKMDVEGAELDILNACSDHDLRRMRAMTIEWHHSKDELERLAQRLRGLGYRAVPAAHGQRSRYLKAHRA